MDTWSLDSLDVGVSPSITTPIPTRPISRRGCHMTSSFYITAGKLAKKERVISRGTSSSFERNGWEVSRKLRAYLARTSRLLGEPSPRISDIAERGELLFDLEMPWKKSLEVPEKDLDLLRPSSTPENLCKRSQTVTFPSGANIDGRFMHTSSCRCQAADGSRSPSCCTDLRERVKLALCMKCARVIRFGPGAAMACGSMDIVAKEFAYLTTSTELMELRSQGLVIAGSCDCWTDTPRGYLSRGDMLNGALGRSTSRRTSTRPIGIRKRTMPRSRED